MDQQIERLQKHDYPQLLDFINMVFSIQSRPHNFKTFLPAYYHAAGENGVCHYAFKSNNRIIAVVGVFPGMLRIQEQKFKIARIGVVSTHPDFRGQKLMFHLLKHCVKKIKEDNYSLAYLAGLRQRYRNYGFEICGMRLIYEFNKNNLKLRQQAVPAITFKAIEEGDQALNEQAKKFYDRIEYGLERPAKDFWRYCLNWHSHALAALDQNGKMLGYLVINHEIEEDEVYITEIAAGNEQSAIDIISAYLSGLESDSLMVEVSPSRLQLIHHLGRICETVSLKDCQNWLILDWCQVLHSLLNLKNSLTPLSNGQLVIGIKDYGSLFLAVNKGQIECSRTNQPPHFTVTPEELNRILFSPAGPDFVMPLPPEAGILTAWCPLPLYICRQDMV